MRYIDVLRGSVKNLRYIYTHYLGDEAKKHWDSKNGLCKTCWS